MQSLLEAGQEAVDKARESLQLKFSRRASRMESHQKLITDPCLPLQWHTVLCAQLEANLMTTK